MEPRLYRWSSGRLEWLKEASRFISGASRRISPAGRTV